MASPKIERVPFWKSVLIFLEHIYTEEIKVAYPRRQTVETQIRIAEKTAYMFAIATVLELTVIPRNVIGEFLAGLERIRALPCPHAECMPILDMIIRNVREYSAQIL